MMNRRKFVKAAAVLPIAAALPLPVMAAAKPAVRTVTINLLDAGDRVSKEWVRDQLIPTINEAIGDRAK